MRRKKTNSDVQARHQIKACRYRFVFFNAPPLPVVYNTYTEDGKERRLKHIENENGTVIYIPKAIRDFDAVDTVKEVDG